MNPFNPQIHLNRRDFIKTAGVLGIAPAVLKRRAWGNPAAADGGAPGKVPFKVIYSNDTTNIMTCTSPFHGKGAPWRPEMLEATVDEVAGHGVDAHFIQLAHGQVPWYQSKVYPLAEHLRWWKEYFEVDPVRGTDGVSGIHRYILDGGDLLRVFVNRCRKTGQAPFVSLRMNDMHHVEHVNTRQHTRGLHSISRFYAEHPEYRIGEGHGQPGKGALALNWAEVAVRERMFGLIAEQCRNYDIDGFEMDFMRHPVFFRLDETTSEQRRIIMRDFIARVRAVLDENPFGRKRWLCVRIPCYMALYDEIGIDPASWAAAGVEMFNMSPHYFTVQQTDLEKVRAQVPDAFIYQEMCHSIWNGKRVGKGYDAFTFRRTTREQYQTTAHLAYEQGADGVSLFNFVYYREHGNGDRGPFAEPPFDVLDHLGNPAWLARQPQHWFVAAGWNPKPDAVRIQIPRKIAADSAMRFELQLAMPARGWRGAARLRVQADASLDGGIFAATLNGERLEETADRAEPYPNPYPSLLGAMAEMRAWNVPARVLKNGINEVLLTLSGKVGNARIVYLDLAARGAQT